MVGLYYSTIILAGMASASFVLPPCTCTACASSGFPPNFALYALENFKFNCRYPLTRQNWSLCYR